MAKKKQEEEDSIKTPVSIAIEIRQNRWLREHPDFNLSGFVQRKLNDEIKREEEERIRDKTRELFK